MPDPKRPPKTRKPRKKPTPPPQPTRPATPSRNGTSGHGEGGAAAIPNAVARMIPTFAQATRSPLEWLLPGLIPANRLVVLVGDQGAGKSLLIARLAADVSCGLAGGEAGRRPPGRVLLYAPEDDRDDELPGRLEAAGADMDRIMDGEQAALHKLIARPQLPDRASELASSLARHGVSLLTLDPVTSFLSPGVSFIDPQTVRAVQEGLASVARQQCCTILCVLQLRKSRQGSPLDWVAGTREWTAVPRHVLTLGRDPRDSDRRVMVLTKCLEGRPSGPRYYTASYAGAYPVLQFAGEASVSAADISGVGDVDTERDARGEARQFLRELLSANEQRQTEIMLKSRSLGISERTLRRAKVDLGVKSEHRGEGNDRHLVWVRPEQWPGIG